MYGCMYVQYNTTDHEIIITNTALNLSADLLFLDIIHITKDYDP